MFWRKKKVPFRDWALRIILGEVFKSPGIDTVLAKVAAIECLKFGIAVGAQFPTKILPILRQTAGDDAENAYGQMRGTLQSWLDSNSGDISIESDPCITDITKSLESSGSEGVTRAAAVRWAEVALFWGLMKGSLHRELYL